MQAPQKFIILFVVAFVGVSYASMARTVQAQTNTSQDVGNIHVMIAAGDTLGSESPPRFSTQAAARQFYATHSDDFDILVYFTNFVTADEAEGFFYEPIRNAVTGIGESITDPPTTLEDYGSASRLKGSVFQGNLSIFPDDLTQDLVGFALPGQNVTPFTILGQEILHRFGMTARFDSDPGPGITPSRDMLGRAGNHWSFFLESQASVFDGLEWRADSSTMFTATDNFRRFSQLDLYLIGAKPASDVSPWFLIENVQALFSGTVQTVMTTDGFPVITAAQDFGADALLIDTILIVNKGTAREQTYTVSDNFQDVTDPSLGMLTLAEKGPSGDAPTGVDINVGDTFEVTFDAVGPQRNNLGAFDEEFNFGYTGSDITLTGTRKDITIDDVIAVEGPRVPAAEQGRSLRVALILLQAPGTSVDQVKVTQLDNIRTGFSTWFNDQSGGFVTLDTTLSELGVSDFTLNDGGGISSSSPSAANFNSGYARIQPGTGNTTPSGVAIFGFRQNGILVSEAGVPASPLVSSGRIYAEVDGPVNTGLAIANPNDSAATIDYFFTDANGVDSGNGSFSLAANAQTAKFLDQDPFNAPAATQGSFTFSSSVPISVIALRGNTNDRGEFLMTTLPVASLTPATEDTIYLPRFVDGVGFTTQVILVNPTDATIRGTVQFFGTGSETSAATPATLTLTDGQVGSSFTYSIPARSSKRFQTSNPATLSQGSVRVVRDSGSSSASELVIFSFASGSLTSTEAGVPASPASAAFRMYADVQGVPGAIGSIRSGVAISNTSTVATTANFELTTLAGVSTGLTASAIVPGSGHIAKFVDELFPTLAAPFQGVLRVTTGSTPVAVVGLRLRINERGEFLITTTAPSDEGGATTTAEQLFPHIVDGGGWSTQFILFSGIAGQSSSGSLRLLSVTGTPLDLTLQ